MANNTAQPGKPTVIYSPLRLNWKNVVAGSVIGLLIVAIGVFSFSYYNPDATPVPPVVIKSGTKSAKVATKSATPSTQKDETADWVLFTDSVFRYSLKHPKEWYTDAATESSDQSFLANYDISKAEGRGYDADLDKGKIKIQVNIDNSNLEKSLDSYVNSRFSNNEMFEIISSKSMTLDGQKAIKVEIKSSVSTTSNVYVLKDKKVYLLSAGLDYQTNKSIFDQILSTFKFLD